MATWAFTCWSCGGETEMDDKIKRSDECPHCRTDMRSCKNCEYYEVGAHNSCRETISEYVPDKERSNLCGMFRVQEGERAVEADVDAAKARLEALFK